MKTLLSALLFIAVFATFTTTAQAEADIAGYCENLEQHVAASEMEMDEQALNEVQQAALHRYQELVNPLFSSLRLQDEIVELGEGKVADLTNVMAAADAFRAALQREFAPVLEAERHFHAVQERWLQARNDLSRAKLHGVCE